MSKEEFYESITPDTVADETFCKYLYYEFLYDKPYFNRVCEKLQKQGNIKAMRAYNEWLKVYLEKERQQAKEIAEWYAKFRKNQREQEEIALKKRYKEEREKEEAEWQRVQKAELLTKKKQLLMQQLKK